MSEISSRSLILGHFANFKLAGDRAVREAVISLQPSDTPLTDTTMRSLFSAPSSRATLRRRRRRRRPATRVNIMSDADLEAELAARRASRARERDRYARSMRSEKLSRLEGELARLRTEISRMDKHPGPPPTVGGGTPSTSRWESLPNARRAPSVRPLSSTAVPSRGPPGGPPGGPPPPPPLPGARADSEDVIDPERQKREKEERQRRREQKRKEREAAKKPITLADIIRRAGPNPAGRLKPSGSTTLPDVITPEEIEKPKEEFGSLRDSLKKAESFVEKEKKEPPADEKQQSEAEERGEKRGGMEGVKDTIGEEGGKKDQVHEEECLAINEKDDIDDSRKDDCTQEKTDENQKGGLMEELVDANVRGKEASVTRSGISDGDASEMSQAHSTSEILSNPIIQEPMIQMAQLAITKDEHEESLSAQPGTELTSEEKDQKAVAVQSELSEEEVAIAGKAADNFKSSNSPSQENTVADPASALSTLTAKLPNKKANPTLSNRAGRRASLAERRKLRRAGNATSTNTGDQVGKEEKSELADVLVAANSLKVD